MGTASGLPAGPDGVVGGRPAPERDLFLDVLRCSALAAVVFNHYMYSVYSWDPTGGTFRMIQERHLGQAWVTWPFVWELPAFFFVGGAVIRSSALKMPYRQFVAKRVWRLAVPAVACFVAGIAVELIANGVGADNCKPGNGPLMGFVPMYVTCPAQVWIGPLWFMMVFVPLTVLSPFLARWYRPGTRWIWFAVLLTLVGLSDLSQFGSGSALPTSELGWLVPWLLGFSYADGSLQSLGRNKLVAWGVVAGAVMVAGIALGPWSSILGRFPRSLETVFEGLVAIPLLVTFRPVVARLGERGPIAWIVEVVGPRMMSLYVWHQPAQAIVIAPVAAMHVRMPDELGWTWLWQKVPWFAACFAVLWVVLKVAEPIERIPAPARLGGPPRRRGTPDPADLEVRRT